MTAKRYDVINKEEPRGQSVTYDGIPCTARTCVTRLNRLTEENEELKQFIQELTTKGTGRIDLADGYSYKVDAILIDFKGDVE